MNKFHLFIRLMSCALSFVLLSGCATSQQKNHAQLSSMFAADSDQGIEVATYDMDRVAKDYTRLMALSRELESIENEAARLVRTLSMNGREYFTQNENNEVSFLVFRFINASSALSEIGDFYFNRKGETPAAHSRGMVLALNSIFNWTYHRARLVAMVMKNKKITALGNSAYPRYGIPAGTYDDVFLTVTSVNELRRLQLSWELFSNDLSRKDSDLVRLKNTDPVYADLINNMDTLHADAVIHIYYVLHESRHSLMNAHNYLRHSKIATMSRSVGDAFKQDVYAAQGSLFKNVARIKRPATQLTKFSEEDLRRIKNILQPGDVILTFTAGYMSNVFLPGHFKHGITYVGTPEQRRAAGLTDKRLIASSVSPAQLKALRKNVAQDKITSGHQADVIEAVAEGVILSSFDEIIRTHVNRMLILRPVISADERAAQLTSLFCYIGMPYDFNFDFSNNSYQCCTELVYRTLNSKGNIDLNFAKVRGKWVLTADDLANYFLNNKSGAFKAILFVDSSKQDPQAKLYENEACAIELRRLMTSQTHTEE
jgi:hypothetical protein